MPVYLLTLYGLRNFSLSCVKSYFDIFLSTLKRFLPHFSQKYVSVFKITNKNTRATSHYLVRVSSLLAFNTLNAKFANHIETSQFTGTANQLTGFYMIGTLVFNRLTHLTHLPGASGTNFVHITTGW